jgi:hypothetical protein
MISPSAKALKIIPSSGKIILECFLKAPIIPRTKPVKYGTGVIIKVKTKRIWLIRICSKVPLSGIKVTKTAQD